LKKEAHSSQTFQNAVSSALKKKLTYFFTKKLEQFQAIHELSAGKDFFENLSTGFRQQNKPLTNTNRRL